MGNSCELQRKASDLTTGEALRALLAFFPDTYEMRLAVNARWSSYERRISWATCVGILLAERTEDAESLEVFTLHARSKGLDFL